MTRQIPPATHHPIMNMLSEEQIQEIHYASLVILRDTGVKMQDPKGRKILLEAGAWERDGRLKLPENLIIDAIDTAPPRIPMYDRQGTLSMPLELGKVFFGTGSDTIYTIDMENGQRRRATTQDVENFARLCDALENIDFVMSMSNPGDVNPQDLYIHSFIRMLRGTIKPNVYTAKDLEDMRDIYRIASAVAGGEDALREKPFFLQYAEPISPLFIIEESLQKVIFCAEKGIPVAYIPSTNPGGGGPVTLAGALALGNAESLLGLVITQLIRPGTPFLYGMNTATLDMKSTIVSYGGPEWSVGMAANTSLGRYYNLPVWGYGGATDSKGVDAQAGIEATLSILTAFLNRTTLVHDVGYIEYGSTSSMEMVVMADEIISMTRKFMDGVQVDRETLALEAIQRAEPGGGFVADKHTFQHFKEAQWFPKLLDRQNYDDWQKEGEQNLSQRANERAKNLLAEHTVPPLPDHAQAVIEDVLAEREEKNQQE